MTEIDLVDWTIQEVQHLKTERREPGDVKNSAVDNLLAVLEPEPMGRTAQKVLSLRLPASPRPLKSR